MGVARRGAEDLGDVKKTDIHSSNCRLDSVKDEGTDPRADEKLSRFDQRFLKDCQLDCAQSWSQHIAALNSKEVAWPFISPN